EIAEENARANARAQANQAAGCPVQYCGTEDQKAANAAADTSMENAMKEIAQQNAAREYARQQAAAKAQAEANKPRDCGPAGIGCFDLGQAVSNVTGTAADLGGGLGNAWSQTVGNNVVNPVADALRSAGVAFALTVGVCVGRSFGFGKVLGGLGKHLEGGGQICLVASTDGQLAVTTVEGGSLEWEAGGGGTISIFATPDSGRIGDQEGDFEVVGVGGKVLGGGDMEISHGYGKCGNEIANVQGGPGAGIGGKLGYGHTETQVRWKSKEDKPC
ncbi:MAG: hypothetical protein ABSB75_02285, partial [Candidatus Limnocylindrales bacterium]